MACVAQVILRSIPALAFALLAATVSGQGVTSSGDALTAPSNSSTLGTFVPNTTTTLGAYTGGREPTIWQRPTVLLLGDSITELGLDSEGGWGVKLAQAYARKADIINRGFGGYNTATMLLSLPEIFSDMDVTKVALATVWLGANDATLPDRLGRAAHVPLDAYTANLIDITRQLQAAGVQQVVLLTPPPVWEGAPAAIPAGQSLPHRTFDYTATYAAAVRSVGAQLAVPVLDVWQLFTSRPEWHTLLRTDGLHLSLDGQGVLYDALMQFIGAQLPSLQPLSMPWHHPTWWFLDYENAQLQWAAEEQAYRAVFRTTQ